MALEPQTVTVADDIFEFSFASSFGVDRAGYVEVLDLSGADLSRVYSGAVPWLFRHQESEILGQVLAVWQRVDKLYCRARLGDSDCARKYAADIRSGILPNVSCRYSILDHTERLGSDGVPVVTITSWLLLEVSTCPIAADPTVGVGRAKSSEDDEIIGVIKTMPSAARISKQREAEERERVRHIEAMVPKWGPKIPGGIARAAELAQRAIDEDMSEQEARSLICDEIQEQPQQSISRPLPMTDGRGWDGGSGTLGMSRREQQSYSIARAIKAAVEGDWRGAEFERECHQELEKQGLRSQGSLVPLEALRAPLLTSNAAQAGNLISTDHLSGSFIDALRASTFVYELGATRMDGLVGNVSIPRQASVSSLGWVSENTDLPESAPSFDKVSLTPKTVGAWTTMSRLMATQADPAVEQLILADFRNSLARELDRTAIHGTGSSGQPTGILNTAGIGSVALGTNGGALTWDSILQLEREIEQDNASGGSMGWVTSVKGKSKLKGTLKNNVAGADYIWMDSPNGDGSGMLSGYRAMASNTVRSDLIKGTGTGLSALVFGDWSSLLIATWGALSLEVDPNHDFRKGTIALRVMLFADMSVRHPESFAAATDVITT